MERAVRATGTEVRANWWHRLIPIPRRDLQRRNGQCAGAPRGLGALARNSPSHCRPDLNHAGYLTGRAGRGCGGVCKLLQAGASLCRPAGANA